MDQAPGNESFFRILFDTAPIPIMILDRDARIKDGNPAACGLIGTDRRQVLEKPCGNAFHCVHADLHPDGCGHAKPCRDCMVRKTVEDCCRDRKILKRNARITVKDQGNGGVRDIQLLVTAAPFDHGGEPLVLVMLQDITELMRLRRILPVCSHCRKVRTEPGYWESVEDYIMKHSDLLLSHSVCDSCMEKHYGGIPRENGDA